jgi:hypothetical protein
MIRYEKEDLYMAIEIVKVRVRPLSREAMKPYGDILDEDHPILPTVDPGQGAVGFEIKHVPFIRERSYTPCPASPG